MTTPTAVRLAEAHQEGYAKALRDISAVAEDALAAAKAEGLREAAADIEADWAPVWGGDSMWMTTGTKVAALVADTLRAMALEVEP